MGASHCSLFPSLNHKTNPKRRASNDPKNSPRAFEWGISYVSTLGSRADWQTRSRRCLVNDNSDIIHKTKVSPTVSNFNPCPQDCTSSPSSVVVFLFFDWWDSLQQNMVLLVYRQGSCSMIFPSANSLVILWTSTRFISSHHLWASLQERHTGAFGIWPQTCLCRPLQKGEWPWMGNPFDWPLERKVHQPIASMV